MVFKRATAKELEHGYGFNPPRYEDLEAYILEIVTGVPNGFDNIIEQWQVHS